MLARMRDDSHTDVFTALNHIRTRSLLTGLLAAATMSAGLAGCNGDVRTVRMVPMGGGHDGTRVTLASPSGPLRLTHRVGGTQHRLLIVDETWYQADGTQLLVLDERGIERGRIEFGDGGNVGPLCDMCVADGRLYVVLEDTAVAAIALDGGPETSLVLYDDVDRLGIEPRSVGIVQREVYAAGVGGVVRLSDGALIFEQPGELVSRVAMTTSGLAACIDRRVYATGTGDYLGTASELAALPDAFDLAGMLAFIRRNDGGGRVGLMRPTMREVHAVDATDSLVGRLHRLRLFDGRLWVVAEGRLVAYRVEGHAIERELEVTVPGIRDVDGLPDGSLAVCGTFGRGVIAPPRTGMVDDPVFVHHVPAPGDLRQGRFDGRYALLAGATGAWMYHPGRGVESVSLEVDDDGPDREVRILDGSASIDEGGAVVVGTTYGTSTHAASATCLAAVEGDVWVGHDQGITVLRLDPNAAADEANHAVVASWRVAGNVIRLWPLLKGNGAVYVSDEGGVGVLQWGTASASAE